MHILTGKLLVQKICCMLQFICAVFSVNMQDLVLHIFFVGHHDRQDTSLRQRQELDVTQPGVGLLGHTDDTCHMRHLRDQLRGMIDQLVHLHVRIKLPLQLVDKFFFDRLHFEQAIDE